VTNFDDSVSIAPRFFPTWTESHTRSVVIFLKARTAKPRLQIAQERDKSAMKELKMTSTLKQFKARALARPKVKKAYDDLAEEFAFLDEVLKARAESGLLLTHSLLT